jgi:hypothetical protein
MKDKITNALEIDTKAAPKLTLIAKKQSAKILKRCQ